MKDKKGTTITNAFQKILDESGHKPNKVWVDKGSQFYNRLMNSRIGKMVKHDEGKSVVAERFNRTLKNKIYNHMTSVSKIAYINKLDDIVNKCIS